MNTMDITRISNRPRVALKHSALALAVAAGLGAGSAQALTTTATYQLGAAGSGTPIPNQAVLSPAWIAAGTLPAGSILRSVSINARIDTAGGDDTYANDLFVYVDPGAPPSGSAILQVGGFDALGSPTTMLTWANGSSGALGTTCVDTKNAVADFPDTIDLNGTGIFLGSRGSITASWSGTITVEYDVPAPASILTFGPGAVVGPLVSNAAAIAWTLPPGTNVTTLAPTFTLSSGSCDKDNGGPTTYDFTSPVVYTVTDGATVNTYTVTVTIPYHLLWNVAGDGDWDLTTSNWLAQPGATPSTFVDGNAVVFDNPAGGTISIDSGISPLSTTVGGTGIYTFAGGPLAGGDLTVSAPGTLNLSGGTYGGTISISGDGTVGRTLGGAANQALKYDMSSFTGTLVLSTGMTAVNPYYSPSFVAPTGGTISIQDNTTLYLGWQGTTFETSVELAGSVDSGEGYGVLRGDTATLNGAVVLGTNSTIGSAGGTFTINALISDGGAGFGFTKVGNGTVVLTAANAYSGPTSVAAGALRLDSTDALGGGDLSISSGGAKVNLNYTGTKAIASLTLGGMAQGGGTYGSLTSDAISKSAYFEGAGTVTVGDPATFAYITSFGANIAGSTAVIDPVSANAAAINWIVPAGTNLATLAPAFVFTPGATCSDQTSGATPTPGFDAGPVVYTIVSQDTTVTNVYTVSVTVIQPESTLIWDLAASGEWNFTAANWKGQSSGLPTVFVDGIDVIFDNAAGGTITVPLTVTVSPGDMTVSATSGTYRWAGGKGKIGGTGTLTKSGAGILKIGESSTNPVIPMLNTFSGGTIINGGELWLEPTSHTGLGTGPVTLNAGTLRLYRINAANNLIVNGGKLYTQNGFGNNWNGTVTLNATLPIEPFHWLAINGAISGPGGLTIQAQTNTVTLTAANSYTGPTSVTKGVLKCNSADSLGGGDLSINGGKLNLSYSGTKTVASLTLGGVAQTTPGTYGSVASGADFQSDTYFVGNGTVTLGGASGYGTWAGSNAPGQTPGEDYDNDGVENGIEYFMGQTGPSFTAMPTLDATNTVTWTKDPAYSGTWQVQTSPDLALWTDVAGTDNGTSVSYTLASGEGKHFVRLLVTPAP